MFLFYDFIHYQAETPMILFLNKKDVFEEKLKTSKLADTFPEYEGKFLLSHLLIK